MSNETIQVFPEGYVEEWWADLDALTEEEKDFEEHRRSIEAKEAE